MSLSNPIDNEIIYRVNGKMYSWCGWYGCQLESLEWIKPSAGTKRKLSFNDGNGSVEMTVYSTTRKGFRFRTTWAVSSSGTIVEHNERVAELKKRLKGMCG